MKLFRHMSIGVGLTVSMVFSATNYYVAPNGTGDYSAGSPGSLAGLPAKIASVNSNMSDDIIFNLKGGRYELSSTLAFDQTMSGTNNHYVIVQANPGEVPVLSGGKLLSNWTLHDASKNIYKAYAGTMDFRQLYVNNERGIRARAPNRTNDIDFGPMYTLANYSKSTQLVTIASSQISNWQNLNQVELAVSSSWNQSRLRISSFAVSGSNANITLMSPEASNRANLENPQMGGGNPFFIENAYELLDAEGEWYLNTSKDTVYYKPRSGENMTTAEVYAPNVTTIVQFVGTSGTAINHFKFSDIVIEHANWTAPLQSGFTDVQANFTGPTGVTTGTAANIPGAVLLKYATGLAFERNLVRHCGAFGILLTPNTNGCRIIGNEVTDISSSGIALDQEGNVNDTISHNTIHAIARDYFGAVGLGAKYPVGMVAEHNEIYHMPYTGISCGWGWSSGNTRAHNNTIRYNDIHHVMETLNDGAAVYTLSNQTPTIIEENYFHHINVAPGVNSYPPKDIYLDQGSTGITYSNNVADNMGIGTSIFTINRGEPTDQAVRDNAGPLPAFLTSSYMVVQPVILKASGTLSTSITAAITSATSGATIRYTIDGSEPNSSSTSYSSALNLSSTTTVKAMAFKSGMSDSKIAVQTFTFTAATPAYSVLPGLYSSTQQVPITCATPSAAIRYTTDGTNPTPTYGTVYSGPVSLTTSTVLKAIACKTGFENSSITSAFYIISSSIVRDTATRTSPGYISPTPVQTAFINCLPTNNTWNSLYVTWDLSVTIPYGSGIGGYMGVTLFDPGTAASGFPTNCLFAGHPSDSRVMNFWEKSAQDAPTSSAVLNQAIASVQTSSSFSAAMSYDFTVNKGTGSSVVLTLVTRSGSTVYGTLADTLTSTEWNTLAGSGTNISAILKPNNGGSTISIRNVAVATNALPVTPTLSMTRAAQGIVTGVRSGRGTLTISVGEQGVHRVDIFNQFGQVVYTINGSDARKYSLMANQFPVGAYVVKIKMGKNSLVRPVFMVK